MLAVVGVEQRVGSVVVRRAPACVLTPKPCTLPRAAAQVLWVGISFQQSASTVYFRKVRCWIQVSAALVLCGNRSAAGGGCSRPAVGCFGNLAHGAGHVQLPLQLPRLQLYCSSASSEHRCSAEQCRP